MTSLFQKLARSRTPHDHLAPFCRLTGLSVSFLSSITHETSEEFARCGSVFCTLFQNTSSGKMLCRRLHAGAEERALLAGEPVPTCCPFGFFALVFPVVMPGRRAGTVLAGKVLLRPPDESKLREQLSRYLGQETVGAAEISELWNAYHHTPVLSHRQFQALSKAFRADTGETGTAAASAHRSDPMDARHEIDDAIAALEENPEGETRVKCQAAKRILLENITAQVGEHVRYLRLKSLGLGVYAVRLADPDAKPRTLLLK